MAKSELRKEAEQLLNKAKIQKDLFNKKIEGVNVKEAAENESLYEAFIPVIDEYLEDLSFLSNSLYAIIEELNNNMVTMFTCIENSIEDVSEEDFQKNIAEIEADNQFDNSEELSEEDMKDVYSLSDINPEISIEGEVPDSSKLDD